MTGIAQTIKNIRWSQWLAILGLAALFLALRWNNYDAPLDRDEGEYAYSAQLLIQGLAPYQHAFIQKPPGVFYTYAVSYLLAPQVYWGPRALAAVFVALTTVILGFIARLEFGEGAVFPVMWLFTPMILLPRLDLADANVEPFLLLPLMATVAVYCYSRQAGHLGKHWFAAGGLAAATLVYKYTAAPILALVFLAWLFEMRRSGNGAASILRAVGLAFAGGVLVFAAGLAFFLAHDGGKTFWECTVTFNKYYARSVLFSMAYFWSECGDLWRNWWILFLIPWAALVRPRLRMWFWTGMFGCSLLCTNGCCYAHYYAILMPFLALLNAAGISSLADLAPQSRAGRLITVAVMVLVIFPDAPWINRSREHFIGEKMGQSPFVEAQRAASEAAGMSSPDDFVYVAGSEPEILYYAQRYSPTRFVTSYPLMDPTPLAAGYQREAINDLQQRPPKVIVFVQWGNSWTRQATSPPEFLNFMAVFLRHYDLVGGYVKSDPPNGYWTTNMSAAEYSKASLLLYRRK